MQGVLGYCTVSTRRIIMTPLPPFGNYQTAMSLIADLDPILAAVFLLWFVAGLIPTLFIAPTEPTEKE